MAPQIKRSEVPEKSGRMSYPASPFRLFEDFFNDWAMRSWSGPQTWTPTVDIMEKDGNLMLMASLPGMTIKDVELKIEGQTLTIKGERSSQESDGYIYHQTESQYGSFSRSFTLPDSTDLDNVKADFKNGILTVTIPQKPEAKPRTIKINT
jgi:HSP20 family protein